MKKMLIFMLAFCLLVSVLPVTAQETAVLPTFTVTLNGQTVDNAYRQFPLLVYKDITYVPMTYYDCRYLGLTTEWDNETRTLSIAQSPVACAYRDYTWQWENGKNNAVEICNFNIVVNGEAIDNAKEEYPLLTFRDVTYFPLTWRFAAEAFGWAYDFDLENGLSIASQGRHPQYVELPYLAGSAATDGTYYYYNGDADGRHVVYRALVADCTNPEIIFEYPGSGMSRRVNFLETDGEIYFYYTIGTTPVMSRRLIKKINADGTLTDEKPAYFAYSAHGYSEVYVRKDGMEVLAVNPHIQSQTEFSYTINGVTTKAEGYAEPVEIGMRRNGLNVGAGLYADEYIRIHEDKIYFVAKNVINSQDSALYVIDTKTGKTQKLIDSVCGFHVYTGWDNRTNQNTTMILYDQNGTLMRYVESDGGSAAIEASGEEGLVLIAATGGYTVSTLQRSADGRKTVVKHFDNYASGTGSIKGTVYETETGTGYTVGNGKLCVYTLGESAQDAARLVMPHEYYTSDVPDGVFIYGDTLLYKLYGENKVVQVDLK